MSVCVYVCVHVCVCTWVSAFVLVIREQWELLLSCGSVLKLKLRSSGLAASAFILWAILPARSWVLNVALLMKPQFFKVSEKNNTIFLRRMSRNRLSSGYRLNFSPSDGYRRLWLFGIQDKFGVGLVPQLKKDGLVLEKWILDSIQRDNSSRRLQGLPAADTGFIQIQQISFESLDKL